MKIVNNLESTNFFLIFWMWNDKMKKMKENYKSSILLFEFRSEKPLETAHFVSGNCVQGVFFDMWFFFSWKKIWKFVAKLKINWKNCSLIVSILWSFESFGTTSKNIFLYKRTPCTYAWKHEIIQCCEILEKRLKKMRGIQKLYESKMASSNKKYSRKKIQRRKCFN